ncbi:MAG: RsmG family class I SAM-dependent methyltransferase [Acidobacteriota bacterium]
MDPTTALQTYSSLLLNWSARVNLLGPEARAHLEEHIAEALEAGGILGVRGEVLDFGSGGGLPAIPLAIQAGNAARFHLVEAHAKKWSFLKYVVRECELNCIVHGDRLQRVLPTLTPGIRLNLVTSRAVGYPEKWVPLLKTRMADGGRVALFQSTDEFPVIQGFEPDGMNRLSRGDHKFLATLRCST